MAVGKTLGDAEVAREGLKFKLARDESAVELGALFFERAAASLRGRMLVCTYCTVQYLSSHFAPKRHIRPTCAHVHAFIPSLSTCPSVIGV